MIGRLGNALRDLGPEVWDHKSVAGIAGDLDHLIQAEIHYFVEDWKYFCRDDYPFVGGPGWEDWLPGSGEPPPSEMGRYMVEKPWYKHDCSACKFLGCHYEYDLYWCPQPMVNVPTVIARFGDEGWEYTSGMPSASFREQLPDDPKVEAWRRAKARGYAMSREELS
jgi:hypothetical protein